MADDQAEQPVSSEAERHVEVVRIERTRVLGFDRGCVQISDDFDAPLPDQMLDDIS
ncbi:MAG: hypothetical protein O3A89_10620 [Actinomycetota bacterium]|jgi:hypothetical protein|nr:hypothetical protein [Actinomycetota bacterium]